MNDQDFPRHGDVSTFRITSIEAVPADDSPAPPVDPRHFFGVDPVSGVVSTGVSFNFETMPLTYAINVTATD